MSTRTILLPLDGSPLAAVALRTLRRLFDAAGTVVILAHVGTMPEGYGLRPPLPTQNVTWGENLPRIASHPRSEGHAIYQSQAWASSEAEVRATFAGPVHDLQSDGYQVSLEVRFGDPPVELAELALDHHVDAVLMGTHGRSGVSRALLGSVAEQVLRRVSVPVIMVRGVV
jgi:nucleotide-binding universal stress UspA family protein